MLCRQIEAPKAQARTFPSGSPSQVRCSVFWSASWPRRSFVDDRRSHEHNSNHLRFGDFTVRFRFDRTGQDPPAAQSQLTTSGGAESFAQEISDFLKSRSSK